jgi:hypothetical protein
MLAVIENKSLKRFFLLPIFAATLFFSCTNENTEITVSLGTPTVEKINKTSVYFKSIVSVSDNAVILWLLLGKNADAHSKTQ